MRFFKYLVVFNRVSRNWECYKMWDYGLDI